MEGEIIFFPRVWWNLIEGGSFQKSMLKAKSLHIERKRAHLSTVIPFPTENYRKSKGKLMIILDSSSGWGFSQRVV